VTGKVIELLDVITPDMLATRLTEKWMEWETLRQVKKNEWEEVRRYVYATDTTQTTNVRLPWKNRTTLPKLCQIRDNLYSNYTATLFPKRKWLEWEANSKDSNSVSKRDAIVNYMSWAIEQPMFKHEIDKIIMDYIDFGNCFATVEWIDLQVPASDKIQTGYVGPMIRRINPLDIVFNPTSENFIQSPKIIRSIVSMGELREMLERQSNDENRAEQEALFNYLKEIRFHARTFQGDWIQRDHLYALDGFTSFRAYLLQDYVEVLTFYGDWYDDNNDTFQKNRVITVVDRHKLIGNKPNPSFFGYPPIFHVPWRKKQDNLWGMGPLDNLIGMQYRLDHIENQKADTGDMCNFPVQVIKGFVEDYVWQPGEKIFVGDEGDVEIRQPEINYQNMDQDIVRYMQTMEELAGAPKEAMGFRSPGEKTAYEVQRMENAASRIYQNKINQFEESLVEPSLNGMLELGRRNMVGATTIRVFDDEFKVATFQTLTPEDITGIGRIKPVAARHFAEKAELIQNITNLTSSGLWQTVMPHFSGVKLAKIVEEVFDLKDYEVVMPFVALAEQAEAQMQQQALSEQMHKQIGTATGMGGDYDTDGGQGMQKPDNSPGLLKRQPPKDATPGGMLATQ
jgi:hypothetical protein